VKHRARKRPCTLVRASTCMFVFAYVCAYSCVPSHLGLWHIEICGGRILSKTSKHIQM